MEIRQLNYFLTLCKYKNYTKAASELYITQPTLSQQIAVLENSLGLHLIDRSGKSFRLTPEGESFLEMATTFMEKYNNFLEDVSKIKRAQKYSLSYASLDAVNAMVTPDLFSAFSNKHPDIDIMVSTTIFYNLVSFVQEKLVDISMALVYSDKEYENLGKIMMHKDDDALTIVIPKDSPYHDAVTFEDALHQGLFYQTCYLYDGWRDYEIPLELIRRHINIPVKTVYYNNLTEFLSKPYTWQSGYTILPNHHLLFINGTSLFKTIPFPEGECIIDCVLLYHLENKNPAAKMFIEELSQPDKLFADGLKSALSDNPDGQGLI